MCKCTARNWNQQCFCLKKWKSYKKKNLRQSDLFIWRGKRERQIEREKEGEEEEEEKEEEEEEEEEKKKKKKKKKN
jgi:hypothetical protein